MSWRDRLQPASFRGVAFTVDSGSFAGGRRHAVHEYPGQDVPWIEDMGRKVRRLSVDGYVVGTDYDLARDALIAALEEPGPGELIHPRYGALMVVVDDYSSRESTREGGQAQFSLTLIESGERQFPVSTSDSLVAVQAGVDNGMVALSDDFAGVFTTTGLPGWVATDAALVLDVGLAAVRNFLPSIAGGVDAVFAATARFDQLSGDLGSLLATPAGLADRVFDAMGGLFDGLPTANLPLLVGDTVGSVMGGLPAVMGTTPSRIQQGANQSAVAGLLTGAATLMATRTVAGLSSKIGATVADSPFTSRQHAWSVRDDLVTRLDTMAATGSDALFGAVRDVTPALVKHVGAHGFGLASAVEHVAQAEVPALVLAHQLYGDASAEQDLLIRNGVRNPGAVAAGVALEVLSNV